MIWPWAVAFSLINVASTALAVFLVLRARRHDIRAMTLMEQSRKATELSLDERSELQALRVVREGIRHAGRDRRTLGDFQQMIATLWPLENGVAKPPRPPIKAVPPISDHH